MGEDKEKVVPSYKVCMTLNSEPITFEVDAECGRKPSWNTEGKFKISNVLFLFLLCVCAIFQRMYVSTLPQPGQTNPIGGIHLGIAALNTVKILHVWYLTENSSFCLHSMFPVVPQQRPTEWTRYKWCQLTASGASQCCAQNEGT